MLRIAVPCGSFVIVGFLATAGALAGAQPVTPEAGLSPRDGATDVSLTNAQLRWPAVPGATSYDVCFGTTPQPRLRATQAGTTFDAGVLETATTYYWRIDAATPGGRVAGQVRTFMTAGAVRFLLVGDSTVTDEIGWGKGFLHRVTSHSTVVNAAKNGRSSKSYLAEGLWRDALAHPADYILIQFGHNDQPGKGPDRETDPATTYRQNLSRYIDEARAAGARPVIVTSLARRQFGPDARIASDLGAYVEAAKAVAADRRVTVVDLHAFSIVVLDRMGPDAAARTRHHLRRTAHSTARTSRRPAAICSVRSSPTNSAGSSRNSARSSGRPPARPSRSVRTPGRLPRASAGRGSSSSRSSGMAAPTPRRSPTPSSSSSAAREAGRRTPTWRGGSSLSRRARSGRRRPTPTRRLTTARRRPSCGSWRTSTRPPGPTGSASRSSRVSTTCSRRSIRTADGRSSTRSAPTTPVTSRSTTTR